MGPTTAMETLLILRLAARLSVSVSLARFTFDGRTRNATGVNVITGWRD